MKYNNEPVDSKTNIIATEIPKTSEVQTVLGNLRSCRI